MNDILERLREAARGGDVFVSPGQAADEIERLRAEIKRLKAGGCARDQITTQFCAEVIERDAEIEKLRAENERLANNARSDARLLAAYHKWCEMNGCAPSSRDISNARAALGEKE